MVTKDQIKAHALNLDMDYAGVSNTARFAESPPGRKPEDILPGCKSVIVVGVSLLDGIVQTNFRAFEDGRRDLKGLYATYGYSTLPNFALTYACYSIGRFIEKNAGAIATPCSTGPMTNGAQLSLRHAGVAAGLGAIGWSGLFMTPEFGPRTRVGVILTTLELEPDPMYDGPPICNPEKCGICTKACPTGAISKHGEEPFYTFSMEGKEMHYCKNNLLKCQIGVLGMNKANGGAEDYITTDDPTPEEFGEATRKMPIQDAGLQHRGAHNCGACLTYCPAGHWNERFKQTGLTQGFKEK